MSGAKVDVLAVLDSLIEYHDTSDSLKGRNCIAARAVVAKLIEAGRECMDTELAEMACIGSMAPAEDALGKLQAALANIGPQP